MRYFYPAIFQQDAESGSFAAVFPHLPGCRAEGSSMSEAAVKARNAMAASLLEMEEKLGLAKRFREIQRGLDTIISEAHAIEDDSIRGATIRDITQHTMKIVEVAAHLND